jgi:uncharacterized protein with von Willebrand factor type A (vWA) domain
MASNLTKDWLLRTKRPDNYYPPARRTILERIEEEKLEKNWDGSLILDMCHLEASGSFIEPDPILIQQQVVKELEEQQAQDGSFPLPIKGKRTLIYTEALQASAEDIKAKHFQHQEFLRTLDFGKIPGPTPFERAILIVRMLEQLRQQANGGKEDEKNGEDLIQEGGQKLANKINEVCEAAQDWAEGEKEGGCLTEREGHGEEEKIMGLLADPLMLEILQVSQKLECIKNMQVGRGIKIFADRKGKEIRRRPIRSYQELPLIGQGAWGIYQKQRTLFWQKMANKEFLIRERISRSEKKQLLYLLLDSSGSLVGRGSRLVSGIAFNRLQAVKRNEAICYISFYDFEKYPAMRASTPEEAEDCFQKVHSHKYGGGTRTSVALKEAITEIRQLETSLNVERPDLLLVTDNDEEALEDISSIDCIGIKVHGICILSHNASLTQLAAETRGVLIENFGRDNPKRKGWKYF